MDLTPNFIKNNFDRFVGTEIEIDVEGNSQHIMLYKDIDDRVINFKTNIVTTANKIQSNSSIKAPEKVSNLSEIPQPPNLKTNILELEMALSLMTKRIN